MDDIGRLAEILRILGDRSRLTILALLRERELCVCELVDALNISQPAISQHLQKMKAYQLVRESRRGRWIFYSLAIDDKPIVRQILDNVPSQNDVVRQINAICR